MKTQREEQLTLEEREGGWDVEGIEMTSGADFKG